MITARTHRVFASGVVSREFEAKRFEWLLAKQTTESPKHRIDRRAARVGFR